MPSFHDFACTSFDVFVFHMFKVFLPINSLRICSGNLSYLLLFFHFFRTWSVYRSLRTHTFGIWSGVLLFKHFYITLLNKGKLTKPNSIDYDLIQKGKLTNVN